MGMGQHGQLSKELQGRIAKGEIPSKKVEAYRKFVTKIEKQILPHPVITQNPYTPWFEGGDFGMDEARYFLQQFSVFSNLFLEAQLKKVINAPNLEAMHASKEILMNELGVAFRNPTGVKLTAEDRAAEVDPSLVGTEGTVEGGTFRFAAAHFEWMLRMISHVGLTFDEVGKRRNGSKSTLFFCDELSRIYGAEDPHTALGASFAVENWAAAGFWKQLIAGLKKFKERECPSLPLAFFTWHDRVEDQHAAHTWTELEQEYFEMDLNENRFLKGGKEMLDGVYAFWKGLNQARLKRVKKPASKKSPVRTRRAAATA